MIGLTMDFVAYEQSHSAFMVAIVVSAFGFAFAIASLVAGHVLRQGAYGRCSSGPWSPRSSGPSHSRA